MGTNDAVETHGQSVLRRFESYGACMGLALGFVIGVIICGPYFHVWEPRESFWIVFCCAVGGAIVGFFAYYIATTSLARGPGIGGGFNNNNCDYGMYSGDCGCSCDGGGGDGGGGSGS